ncbi:MAG: hypothetical protein RSA22_07300 [Acinetobacter sp.]
MSNLHPCANKCSEYKAEQCKSCLIQETKVQGVYVMGKADDMGDDAHIENHISPNCRINCFQDDTTMGTRTVDIEAENERLKTENIAMQAEIDDLQKRLDAVKLDLSIFSDFIKRFDANTDTATIVGTLYGFVDELEQSLGGEA